MEKKRAKQEAREQQEALIEERKRRKKEQEMALKQKEKEKEEEQRKEDELFERVKKDKENKENAEFDRWKSMFKVSDGGSAADNFEAAAKIEDFIQYIKLRKVVSLQELGGEFKLSNKSLVTRLLQLEEQGRLSGIIDDRGKYIYLSEKEIATIEKVFVTRGRISKTDLIGECNRLIKFEPSEADKEAVAAQRAAIVRGFEEEINKES